MFTGIVTETGRVVKMSRAGETARIEIACGSTAEKVETGDSVAVNGVCLSVVDIGKNLAFDVVGNTLKKTALKRLKTGAAVNLENALRMGDDVSGHMVSGHVDGERRVRRNQKASGGWVLEVATQPGDGEYLVPGGSVAIDGVSLTVGEMRRGCFRVYLIPHTLAGTTLEFKKTGDYVNIEFDMMSKYPGNKSGGGAISETMLRDKGFM